MRKRLIDGTRRLRRLTAKDYANPSRARESDGRADHFVLFIWETGPRGLVFPFYGLLTSVLFFVILSGSFLIILNVRCRMEAERLSRFLERGPFIAEGNYVAATHAGAGYGDIIARCCNGRCSDGTVIDAAEVAVLIAETLNDLMRRNAVESKIGR